MRIFGAFAGQKRCFFLDSSLYPGRYSFLGADPFYVLESGRDDPLPELRKNLDRYKITLTGNAPPFLGGAVGHLAYDLGFALEKKFKNRQRPKNPVPDFSFGFYNTMIAIDHLKKLLYIFAAGFPEKDYRLQKALCRRNFRKIQKLLSEAASSQNSLKDKSVNVGASAESNFTKEAYMAAVRRAKEYIKKGDIYQVNLAQVFRARTDLSAPQIYKRLRKFSPSCFGAYIDYGDYQILSSSPEAFLRLERGRVTTRPMKGTRPRSKNKALDIKLKEDLIASAKDKAELMMIVDLERNDLGRVCSYDSIKVSRLRQLEKYSTVFQTTATVYGCLHKNQDRVDLIRACFPGGSITGCPKIRAMEIIDELETRRRSIYTGSLGYLSFSGGMDLNILIRTILKKDKELYFGVGGGIVADSKPEEEYRETLVKAKGMMQAIK